MRNGNGSSNGELHVVRGLLYETIEAMEAFMRERPPSRTLEQALGMLLAASDLLEGVDSPAHVAPR